MEAETIAPPGRTHPRPARATPFPFNIVPDPGDDGPRGETFGSHGSAVERVRSMTGCAGVLSVHGAAGH